MGKKIITILLSQKLHIWTYTEPHFQRKMFTEFDFN